MKKSIFDIGAAGRALEAIIEENEGELDAELEEWFDDIQDEREAKIESYCYLIAEYEARADARRQKVKELEAGARANEKTAKRLKDRLLKAFEVFGWDKVKAGSLLVKRAKNGGRLPVLWATPEDLNELPPEFIRQVPTLDKEAVLTALEVTPDLGFAKLGERGFHIEIK